MKYRIKTKDEFIREFGDNWRDKVYAGFTPKMDSLFNRTLTESEYNELCSKRGLRLPSGIYSWGISEDMVYKPLLFSCYFTFKKMFGYV